jgi:hypothetical protein
MKKRDGGSWAGGEGGWGVGAEVSCIQISTCLLIIGKFNLSEFCDSHQEYHGAKYAR